MKTERKVIPIRFDVKDIELLIQLHPNMPIARIIRAVLKSYLRSKTGTTLPMMEELHDSSIED